MDTTIVALCVTLLLAAVAGVVWAIRLEGKVSEHDQLFEERKTQADERHSVVSVRLVELKDELRERLVRIEQKLDTIAYGTAFPTQKP